MSDKDRQKKDHERNDKQNKAMRENQVDRKQESQARLVNDNEAKDKKHPGDKALP